MDPLTTLTQIIYPHVSHCCRHIRDEEVHQTVKDRCFRLGVFDVEIQDNTIKSLENKRPVEILEKTLRKVGKHYEIGLPWKQKGRACFIWSEKWFKTLNLLSKYIAKITEYVEKGYATRLNPSGIPDNQKTWNLPYFSI